MKLPMQPLVRDEADVARFRENGIVRFLLDAGPYDMNKIAALPVSREERVQFAQLIGYSLDGFSELSYVEECEVTAARDAVPSKIDALPAGRELDAVVAEKVMGVSLISRQEMVEEARRVWLQQPTCRQFARGFYAEPDPRQPDGIRCHQHLPAFSADIAAAWQVVEKLGEAWWPEVGYITGGLWYCECCRAAPENPAQVGLPIRAVAETAPLAVCRAALKVALGERCAHCGHPRPRHTRSGRVCMEVSGPIPLNPVAFCAAETCPCSGYEGIA